MVNREAQRTLVADFESLMGNLGLTVDLDMDAVSVPQALRETYAARVENRMQ